MQVPPLQTADQIGRVLLGFMDKRGRFFCGSCGTILEPLENQNAFDVFDLPLSFDVDEGLLEKTYWDLQKQLHPDMYHTRGKDFADLAEEQSSLVNDSYHLLKSPYERSKLILNEKGFDIGDEERTYSDPSLLMEVMEIRESIEDSSSDAELEAIGAKNQEKIEETVQVLERAHETRDYDSACQQTIRLRYLNTIRNEVYGLVD
eukprot:g3026.t1